MPANQHRSMFMTQMWGTGAKVFYPEAIVEYTGQQRQLFKIWEKIKLGTFLGIGVQADMGDKLADIDRIIKLIVNFCVEQGVSIGVVIGGGAVAALATGPVGIIIMIVGGVWLIADVMIKLIATRELVQTAAMDQATTGAAADTRYHMSFYYGTRKQADILGNLQSWNDPKMWLTNGPTWWDGLKAYGYYKNFISLNSTNNSHYLSHWGAGFCTWGSNVYCNPNGVYDAMAQAYRTGIAYNNVMRWLRGYEML